MPPSAAPGKIQYAKIGPWKGMNERVSPDTLPPGVAADLQNVLLDEAPGRVVKRLGTVAQAALPSGLPPRDSYVFTKLDGTAYCLVSDGVTLYYTTDPSNAALYTSIKTGLNTDGFMQFETAGNKVWMCNGIDAVMSWDGTTLLVFNRTFTSITNLTTASTTSFIHAGLTSSDSYWTGMKLVFTVGANVGTVVTVTNYVESTKTITFTPAVAGIAATDRFIVGVSIPKGSALRFYDGHLFIGCTADNQAELRFSAISDPDTGALITLDNPRAWPSANELALNVLDQEKIWGITPILRDRIMVHKAGGLWRLERDPLVVYRLEVVSRAVGSRFPDTWAEKNNLLYFLGQDKDGYPEIYKTDLVDVTLVDPDGGIEPTLRGLQQPSAVQQSQTFTSQADFDAGTKSTGQSTESGQLGVGAFDALDKWEAALVSASNIDLETTPGVPALLGTPSWAVRYEADTLPSAATPAWSQSVGSNGSFPTQSAESVGGGVLSLSNGGTYAGGYYYYRDAIFDATKDTLLTVKIGGSSFIFGLFNGTYGVLFSKPGSGNLTVYKPTLGGTVFSPGTGLNVYTLLLKSTGAYKLWANGTLVDSGTAASSALNRAIFGMTLATSMTAYAAASVGQSVSVDYAYYHADFKGDNLDSQGGLLSPTSMPNTLPSTGNIVVLNDMTRAPDAMRRLYQVSTLYGGTVALESYTASATNFLSGVDPAGYVSVANGAVPTSLALRAQRIRTTITALDGGNAPVLTALYTGVLWLSPAVQLGATISAWRTFLDTLVTPAGTDQTVKIRRATVSTSPIESDWGAWFVIVNGNNIGTILSDATPPTSRWVQLKVEQGPSSAGLLPYVDAAVVQWVSGSAGNLPVRGVVHKKRYLIVAATALAAVNDIIVVCDRNDQWTKFTGLGLNALIHYKGNLYGLDAAAATARKMEVEGLYNDDGVAISAFLVGRGEDFGFEQLRKNLRYSYLHWDRASAAASLTTSYKRAGDAAFTGSGTFTFGTTGQDIRQNFPVATVGKRIQRKYANAVLDQNMALQGETFYFDVRAPQP